MCSQSVQPIHSANCFYYLVTPGRHMYLTDGSGSADFTIPISQLRKPDWPYVGKVSENKKERIRNYILRGSHQNILQDTVIILMLFFFCF